MTSIEQDPIFDNQTEYLHLAEVHSFESEQIVKPASEANTEAEIIDLNSSRASVESAYEHALDTAVELDFVKEPSTVYSPELLPTDSKPESLLSKLVRKVEAFREAPQYKPRAATLDDVDAIVGVDLQAFSSVYSDYEKDSQELRNEMREKFRGRILKHGGDWMQVLEKDGKICGFINLCPTNKSPEEFTSWEETTDNGTLETTYDPHGKYLYIVSLSMIPSGTAEQGQNMLFANQIGKMIEEGYSTAFFESRLPGLRTWVRAQCRRENLEFDELTQEDKQDYADNYMRLRKDFKGKNVAHDRLVRMYEGVGCKMLKAVPDAYKDQPSMNFGAVAIYENPLPSVVQKNWLVRKTVGKAVRAVSHSHTIMKKLF